MAGFWPWELLERDHEIQNPLSAEKIRLLGSYLRLGPGSRVLDVACGKGGPARILAATYGCRVTGVEVLPAFADEARARAEAEGLASLVEVHTGDAARLEPASPTTRCSASARRSCGARSAMPRRPFGRSCARAARSP